MDPIVCILSRKVFITAVTEKNSKKNLNLCIKDNVKTLVQFLFFPRQVVCETLECGGRAKIRHLVVIISIRKLKKKKPLMSKPASELIAGMC